MILVEWFIKIFDFIMDFIQIWDSNRIKLDCTLIWGENTDYVPILKINNTGKKTVELEYAIIKYKGKEEGKIDFSANSKYYKFFAIDPNSKVEIPLEAEEILKSSINAEKAFNTPAGEIKNPFEIILKTKGNAKFFSKNYFSDRDILELNFFKGLSNQF